MAKASRRPRRSTVRSESRVARVSLVIQALAALGAAGAVTITLPPALGALRGVEVSQRQLDVAVQGQVTDRFTAAVDQLGSDKEEVRLGGIYALERLARDSVADQPVVVEVLCAFVRLHSPASPGPAPGVRTAVAAAVSVVVRRESRPEADRIDLVSTGMAGLDLGAVTRPGEVPNLFRARLLGSRLDGSELGRANLQGADLTGASMRAIRCRGNFGGAVLTRASFADAVLEGAFLDRVFAKDASFARTRLNGAYLRNASLTATDLTAAVLDGAHLEDALAPGADFAGASLDSTYLSRADLSGARNLTLEQLLSAQVDETTLLPPGFRWNPALKTVEVVR